MFQELCQVNIYDALRDLVPFIQFKKREKHPWRGVNFSTQKNGMIESKDNEVWKHTH